MLGRRGQVLPAADSARWRPLCEAAVAGRAAAAEVLLDELRAAAEHGTAQDRAIALNELLYAAPRLWPVLDRASRAGPARPRLPRAAAPAPVRSDDADPLALVLASFDPDGRVRQAAVERLALRAGGPAVTALALRTDDWVAAVREPALAALLARLAPDEATAAVRILARLAGRSRAGRVLERYREALRAPERRRTVRRLAAEPDRQVRRFGVELALELGEYVRGDLARTALHDRDQVCRRLCAQRLLDLDPDQAGRLMWARFAGVRELAVAALPDDVPAARLVAPLADRSRLVRAQARWKLYKRGEPPADVYRRQLRRCGRSTQPRLVAGLAAGLGECGDASDLPMLTVLAEDPSWAPVTRRAAVRALGRLAARAAPRPAAGETERALGRLVGDDAPSVAREALDALAATGHASARLLGEAVGRPEPQVWRAALRGARTLEYFDRLELALRAAGDPRPEVTERAASAVGEWQRLRWPGGPVDGDQLRRLTGLLRGAGLPERRRAELHVALRAAGRAR